MALGHINGVFEALSVFVYAQKEGRRQAVICSICLHPSTIEFRVLRINH